MGKLKNEDLLLVNSNEETYTATGEAFITSWYEKPVIANVNLVETNPGVNPRFTNQQMVATVTLSEDGIPQSEKTIDAYVQGAILSDLESDVIIDTEELDGGWISASASAVKNWRTVTHGNGTFVALSSGGTDDVMYSDDGISWTSASATSAYA